MDYKKMLEIIANNANPTDELYMVSRSNRPAITNVNGYRRWLENGQIIRFDNPSFSSVGDNAEFEICGCVGQTIWFSQISNFGLCDDLQTPLVDIIVFKDELPCAIRERYESALAFWNGVENKSFRVEIIGSGFTLNGSKHLSDDIILEKIRQSHVADLKGVLKTKQAYKLIEI